MEIEKEMNRIDSLPGAMEFYDSYQEELDEQMEPLLDEIGKKATQIMDSMMGGVMEEFGGMMEGFEPLSIGMAAWGMVMYMVVGFVLSIWISGRRQLA